MFYLLRLETLQATLVQCFIRVEKLKKSVSGRFSYRAKKENKASKSLCMAKYEIALGNKNISATLEKEKHYVGFMHALCLVSLRFPAVDGLINGISKVLLIGTMQRQVQ